MSCFSSFILTKEQIDHDIDIALEGIDKALDLLMEASDYVPLPGANKVVPVIQSVVQMIKQTRANDETARNLVKSIAQLVDLLQKTREEVEAKIKEVDRLVGRKSDLDRSQISATMDDLYKDLDGVRDKADRIPRETFILKCLQSNKIASKLEGINGQITEALDKFKLKRDNITASLVEHMDSMIAEMYKMQQESKEDHDDDILLQLPHADAGYQAADHGDFLKGTRVQLLEELEAWATSPDSRPESRIFLLSGAAGMGKSTLAREVARRLEHAKHLGASFFFIRSTAGDLGSTRLVFPTIAYQLAALCPDFRPAILKAVKEYRKLPSAQLGVQLERLILEPLKDTTPGHGPVIIILDAVDECSDDLVQLFKLIKRLNDLHFPLRTLITGRPEFQVEHAVKRAGYTNLMKHFEMEHIPPEVVDADIKLFLTDRFQEKLYCGPELLEMRPNAIDALTQQAEQLFVYAQVVVEALTGQRRVEVALKHLDSFLGGKAAHGLSALDTLYLTVLDNAYTEEDMSDPDVRARVLSVIASIVVLQDQVTLDVLTPLFGLTADSAILTLKDLHSVIVYDEQNVQTGKIHPLHSTFREFIVDKERCKNANFWIDTRLYHGRLAVSCLNFLNDVLTRNICHLPDPTVHKEGVKDLASHVRQHIPLHVQYACKYWATHLTGAEFSEELSQLLQKFCTEKLLFWLEALSMMNRLDLAIHALSAMHTWYQTQANHDADILALLYDGYRLVLEYFVPINTSPEQIYISALHLMPSSRLFEQYAASASNHRSVKLVSPREDQWAPCLRVMEGHTGRVNSVAFSPDERWIVSGAGDNTVRIWDAVTGLPVKTLEGHIDEIHEVFFHPDGLHVFSCAHDETVKLWDPLSASPLMRDVSPGSGHVFSLAITHDGSKLVAGSYRRAVHIWNTEDAEVRSHPIANVFTETVAFSLDGTRVLGATRNIFIWDAETGAELMKLEGHTEHVRSAKFFPDESRIVSSSDDKTVRVWKIDCNPVECRVLNGHIGRVFSVDVSYDAKLVVSGSDDSTIRLWDVESGQNLAVYRHNSWVHCVRFSAKADRLVSGSSDNTVRVWDLAVRTTDEVHIGHSQWIACVRFSPNMKTVATSSKDGLINLWNTANGRIIRTLKGHKDGVQGVSFSSDGRYLASGGETDGLIIWEVESGDVVKNLRATTEEMECYFVLAFSPDGKWLAAASGILDPFVRFWDASNSEWTLEKQIRIDFKDAMIDICEEMQFSLDGRFLSIKTGFERFFYVWDVSTEVLQNTTEEQFKSEIDHHNYECEAGWIQSTDSSKRLCWIPESIRAGKGHAFATVDGLVCLGAGSGRFTILDMSGFSITV
ncbi:hypothetical protein CERSUDRAFT_99405 [Gelatoporia subvermispora B]|uniref:NACHT domain-containing protein n=1 Tax=Ceriporiopsis subvermispora (strain B) TaxID=914234 RepID=M2PAV3_CERS8|nr:hypothetical protein CERSUDRAFT_99405 [Gelatoporia subvermispora B]